MILHFDFSTGASGDKILGALLEVNEALGTADFADLQRIGAALVPGARIERRRARQGGIQATAITVTEPNAPVRHWHEIHNLIEGAGASATLSADTTARALKAFEAIAQAEAAVHGCALEQVHFHEVGAADSIIDICCSSYLFDRLAPEATFATPLALGSGSFVCSHGELPVPAPATARIIEGMPVYAGTHDGEMTTPTGAALARTFVSAFEPLPCVRPMAVGYGAGSRVLGGTPNVVRILAGVQAHLAGLTGTPTVAAGRDVTVSETVMTDANTPTVAAGTLNKATSDAANTPSDAAKSDFICEGCALLETNIDHLSPEALAFACEELLAANALDVWQEPITMKKGRLAVRLCVLAPIDTAQAFAERVAALTGSLGVRSTYVERICVARNITTEQTPWGSVTFKTALVATPSGHVKLRRPEYEDVAHKARTQNLNFNILYDQLLRNCCEQ